jgi:hypothetical protein
MQLDKLGRVEQKRVLVKIIGESAITGMDWQ